MVASSMISGTSPSTIILASPSAIAVLPTPASPTNSGLFLRRRQRIWIVRSTSARRPMRGSVRPSSACWLRLTAKASRGDFPPRARPPSPPPLPPDGGAPSSLSETFDIPWEM